MLSGDFWDRLFCRISTIPANALSGGLIGAVKLHSRFYLITSITLSKSSTFFPSVTPSVIIHCSNRAIGGPGLRRAIKWIFFPPTAGHFNSSQNTRSASQPALMPGPFSPATHWALQLLCGMGLGLHLQASSCSQCTWLYVCKPEAASQPCATQELSVARMSALAKVGRAVVKLLCPHHTKVNGFVGMSMRITEL